MTIGDPPRILSSLDPEHEVLKHELIRAQTDAPVPERLAQIEAKVLAGVVASVATGAAATKGKAALVKVAFSKAAILKWIVGATVVVSAGGAVAIATHTPSRAIETVTPPVASSAVFSAPPFARESASAAEPQAVPVASTSTTAAPFAPAPAAPSRTPTENLAEETRLLSEAQRALASSPAEALRFCQMHRASFPSGTLAQERDAVSIEALVKLGRSGEAQKAAANFERAYPGSSHLRRVHALVSPNPAKDP